VNKARERIDHIRSGGASEEEKNSLNDRWNVSTAVEPPKTQLLHYRSSETKVEVKDRGYSSSFVLSSIPFHHNHMYVDDCHAELQLHQVVLYLLLLSHVHLLVDTSMLFPSFCMFTQSTCTNESMLLIVKGRSSNDRMSVMPKNVQ
jgi:hypothetical protein